MITTLMRPFFRKGQAKAFSVPGGIGEESSVLCLDTGDLSDLIFHVPLIRGLRRRFPGLQVDFLVPEKHVDLVVPSGLARHCIIYKSSQLNPWRPAFGSLLKKLGEGDYDMAVVMSFRPQPRLELAAMASGAALRLGPSHDDAWPSINFEIKRAGAESGYLGDRLRRAAPFLGLAPEEMNLPWPLPNDRVRQVAQQVHFHKPNPDQMLIGVDPCAGKTGHALSLDNLLFLVRQLNSQLVCKVLPLGNPEQKQRLEQFQTRLSEIPTGLNRETLLEMVLLLSQCDLFLAGNTDFFHFAVSLGVPAIGLFTDDDLADWSPQNRDRVSVLSVAKGEKVDIETLMEAVEAVTGGRTSRPSTVIHDQEDADPTVPGTADAAAASAVNGGAETSPDTTPDESPDAATEKRLRSWTRTSFPASCCWLRTGWAMSS